LYHGQIEYIRNWGIQGFRNLKYEFINSSIPKFAIPEFGSPINRNFHFVPTGFAESATTSRAGGMRKAPRRGLALLLVADLINIRGKEVFQCWNAAGVIPAPCPLKKRQNFVIIKKIRAMQWVIVPPHHPRIQGRHTLMLVIPTTSIYLE